MYSPWNDSPGTLGWKTIQGFLECGFKSKGAFKMHALPTLEHFHKHCVSLKIASNLHQGHLWSFLWHFLMFHIWNLPHFGASELPLTARLIFTFFWHCIKFVALLWVKYIFIRISPVFFCFLRTKEESGLHIAENNSICVEIKHLNVTSVTFYCLH